MASRRASRAKRARRSGSAREVRRQDLDGDVAPELAVARAIDLAHAAGAERRHDRVWAELTIRSSAAADRVRRDAGHTTAAGVSRNRAEADSKREQRLDFLPQRLISMARLRQERAALLRRTRQRARGRGPRSGCAGQAP